MRPPCQTTMPVRELHVRRRSCDGGDGSGGEQRQNEQNHAPPLMRCRDGLHSLKNNKHGK